MGMGILLHTLPFHQHNIVLLALAGIFLAERRA
jgi:hypothetical protein